MAGIGLRRWGWGRGIGAPPGGEGRATKDAPCRGHGPRGPTLSAAPAPRGSPPAALRTQASGLSLGWGRLQAAFSSTPGPQEGIPGLPGGGGGRPAANEDRAARRNSARFRGCPSPWPDDPALGLRGPTGRPLPPRSFQRRAKVGFGTSSLLLPSLSPPFSPLLPSSEPNRGARQIFLLFHLLLLPGVSAEEGSPEGGMWVSF